MSKADEMFKELGYKQLKQKFFIMFSNTGLFGRKVIIFHKNKKIGVEGLINLEELQAINEKVKELGWNENI